LGFAGLSLIYQLALFVYNGFELADDYVSRNSIHLSGERLSMGQLRSIYPSETWKN